ncbi:hypothetical protein G4B88_030718, partial [Cannabis sativa]
MVGRKKRAPETDANKIMTQPSLLSGPSDASGYEQSRDLRIKENKERMNKFGILHLSHKLKSEIAPRKRLSRHPSETKKTQTLPSSSGSPRRSSRLKTLDKVSYVELRPKRTKGSSESDEIRIRDGLNPEIYTEEHEKLLGDCKNTWTLLVDGYGEDGKRIYDEVNGETCHQCRLHEYINCISSFRQKTLGHHTHCSKCNLVQGQFCGDCLYSRYGENVIETKENPSWICPVCRDICNCSLCRKAKGWMPTGQLTRKVFRLGYKSVAHYLIQTFRSQTKTENSCLKEASHERNESLTFQPENSSHDDPDVDDEGQKDVEDATEKD